MEGKKKVRRKVRRKKTGMKIVLHVAKGWERESGQPELAVKRALCHACGQRGQLVMM